MPKRRYKPHDLAAEVVRRAGLEGGYVVRVSDPPTPFEQLQLMSARLERRPVAIMPAKCATMDEWRARYGPLFAS